MSESNSVAATMAFVIGVMGLVLSEGKTTGGKRPVSYRAVGDTMDLYPDSFPRDPYGHLTNQSGHAVLGIGFTLAALTLMQPVIAWIVVTGIYFVVWECLVQRDKADALDLKWDWRDSLDDTSNFAGGAAMAAGVFYWMPPDRFWPALATAAACAVMWAAALALSTRRRM